MPRNWLLAHWRRLAMQGVLCAVLLATIGLAALVTHEKRLALRLPLGPVNSVGQMTVYVPRAWATPAIEDQSTSGDSITVDEIVPEQLTGRRLTVTRLRTGGLIPPMQLLLRNGYLSERDLLGVRNQVADADEQIDPARVQRLTVAGWPGVMVSYAFGRLGSRHVEKTVLACSSLPNEQAVVIRLVGAGSPDAADDELVKQIAETTVVHQQRSSESAAIVPQQPGAMVKLDNDIWTAVPTSFVVMPADPHCLSRDLLANRTDGAWTAAELIPCLWLADENPETQILTMLTARDAVWRSATVTRIGEHLWRIDPLVTAVDNNFPVAAYCMTSETTNQSLLAILHAGAKDQSDFDETWRAISSDVRFLAHRDMAALLHAGETQAAQFREAGLDKLLPTIPPTPQHWSLWDKSSNADKQDWMQLDFTEVTPENAAPTWRGSRFTIPTYHRINDQAPAESVQQSWNSSNDLSKYRVSVDRIVSNRGSLSQQTAIGRWTLQNDTLQNEVAQDGPHALPKQYVPGAWLPLIMAHCSDEPMILRTESFLSCDGSAPPGLLTLLITASTLEGGIRSVNVTVNGSGRSTRWSYMPDGTLRYIDFTSDWQAQRNYAITP